MKKLLLREAAKHKLQNRRRKRWQKTVSILACLVVFCTVYALILPALTAEADTYCGKEEHTHTEDCYKDKLICGKEEGQGAHHHTDDCYREVEALVCPTPESDGHQHTEACYTEEQVLTCTNTDEGHVHSEFDSCYTTEKKLTCGMEEGEGAHHHTAECYETKKELICGQEENDGHRHTAECYEKELICGKEEHLHILACYSNPNADVENGDVWQNTVSSVTLTGNWGADLAAIAQTQTGYTESTANYAVAEDGQTIHGYTRYGAWANDPYRDNWSAQFADFCLSYAGVPTSAVPQNSDCSAWNYTIPDGYTPKTGDLLLLDTDNNGSADHAGIVISADDSALTAIVGDADKAVRNNTYNIGSENIKGYVSIPENPALADDNNEEETTETTPAPEVTEEPQETPAPEVTPEAEPTQEPEPTPEVTEEPTQEPENKTDDVVDNKADENKTQDEDVKEDDGKKDGAANNIEVTPTPEVTEESTVAPTETPAAPNKKPHKAPTNRVTSNGDVNNLEQYITSATVKKKNGDTWQESGEITEGDSIKVEVGFSVASNVVTTANPTMTYQLPLGIRPDQPHSGTVSGTIGTTKYDNLGTYTIGTDGKVEITFNDTFIHSEGEFVGGLQYEGTASLSQDKDTEEVQFKADGKTYTIVKKEVAKDLTVKKEAQKIEGNKIKYVITATSISGTKDVVQIQDTVTYEGLNSVSIEKPNVIKGEQQVVYSDSDYELSSYPENKQCTYKLKLPQLGANENYVITYYVDYGETLDNNVDASISNNVIGYDGNNWKSQDGKKVIIANKFVKKEGSAVDNNQYIQWTITVNPNETTGFAGEYTLTDLLNGEKNDISEATDLKISKIKNYQSIEATDTFKNGKLTIEDGYKYEITYKTPINYGNQDYAEEKNQVTFSKDNKSYSAEKEIYVSKSDIITGKQAENQVVSEDKKNVRQKWKISLIPEKGSQDVVVVTDTMKDNMDQVNASVHWSTRSLLMTSLRESLNDKTIIYSLKCYDVNNAEVSDDSTAVVKFELTLKPQNTVWSGNQLDVTYESLFNIENVKSGATLTVKNTAEINGTPKNASASYTNKKDLIKYAVGVNQYNHTIYQEGTWETVYNAQTKQLKYRIIVFPSDTNAFTIEDTIPNGLTLDAKDVSVTLANRGNNYDFTVQEGWDLKSTENSPIITVDGQNLKVQFKGGFPSGHLTGGDGGFAVDYKVTVSDEFWNNLQNSEKTYTNVAKWNGKTESQETTIKRNTPVLAKDGEQLTDEDGKPQTRVRYYVTINPAGIKLNNGKNLKLTDNLNPNGVTVDLVTDSVKLYSYNGYNENGHYKGEELSASAFKFKFDSSVNKFIVEIPDALPCVLEYVYEIGSMNDKQTATFSNSAELTGVDGSSTTTEIIVQDSSSGVWVSKANTLQIIKVDADRNQITLQGAKFKTEKYVNSQKWNMISESTTDQDGSFSVDLTKIKRNALYKLTEIRSPEGYALSDENYYFVPLSDGMTADRWMNDNVNTVNELKIKKADIKFIDNGSYGTIYIPNKANSLKVNKLWLNTDGSPANGIDDVIVQLYQNTTKLDSKTVTVQFAGLNYLGNFMEKQYQVKTGTDFCWKLQWGNSIGIKYNGNISTVQPVDGVCVFDCGSISEDVTIFIDQGWEGMQVDTYCTPVYTPADYVNDDSKAYETPITLNPSNGYTHQWMDLPTEVNGTPVYYTVKEISNISGYTTSYMNNEGVQSGEITITNRKIEQNDYVLPETGGTGTNRFTAVGLALMAGSLMCGYVMRRKCREGRRN